MDDKLFEELELSLRQMADHAAGKKVSVRETKGIRPPRVLSKEEIVSIRGKLKVSQGVMAQLLNVSPKTIQSWEQGHGRPSGPSLKLLNIARKDPKILFMS